MLTRIKGKLRLDARLSYVCKSTVALVLFGVVWFYGVSWGMDPKEPVDAISPALMREVIAAQNKTIFWLVGIVQALMGFIYVTGIMSVKTSIRTLFTEIKEVREKTLTKDDHDRLCDAKEKGK